MGVYDRQIANAKRAIKAKGQLVTWQINNNSENAAEPWNPGAVAPTNKQVSILFLPINRQGQELIRLLKGTDIATGSLSGLMGAVDFEPKINDLVLRGNETLTIKNVDPLAPNGDVILYTIEFQK